MPQGQGWSGRWGVVGLRGCGVCWVSLLPAACGQSVRRDGREPAGCLLGCAEHQQHVQLQQCCTWPWSGTSGACPSAGCSQQPPAPSALNGSNQRPPNYSRLQKLDFHFFFATAFKGEGERMKAGALAGGLSSPGGAIGATLKGSALIFFHFFPFVFHMVRKPQDDDFKRFQTLLLWK